MAVYEQSFGPSALATPANAVTITRLLLAIPLLMLIADHTSSWPAVALWIILCVTDGIDGYLARRQGATRSGAFLDPLADKVLVLGAMIALGRSRPVLVGSRGDHRGARDRDQRVPQLLGAPRPRGPGDAIGEGEDGRARGGGRAARCCRSPPTTDGSPARCCGPRSC